jgi:hypothetical protein
MILKIFYTFLVFLPFLMAGLGFILKYNPKDKDIPDEVISGFILGFIISVCVGIICSILRLIWS